MYRVVHCIFKSLTSLSLFLLLAIIEPAIFFLHKWVIFYTSQSMKEKKVGWKEIKKMKGGIGGTKSNELHGKVIRHNERRKIQYIRKSRGLFYTSRTLAHEGIYIHIYFSIEPATNYYYTLIFSIIPVACPPFSRKHILLRRRSIERGWRRRRHPAIELILLAVALVCPN